MKGLIIIRDPIGTIFNGNINIPSNSKRYDLRLKRDGRGGSLKVRVRSNTINELECFKGKNVTMTVFRFNGLVLVERGEANTVTGQCFDTGKYVPWTARFQKTGN